MSLNRILIFATLLCASSAGAHAEQREFVVSYWYGPPAKFTTIEHYRRIKEANFNVVFPPRALDATLTVEQNVAVLDLCRALDLRAVVYDPRMPRSLAAPGAKGAIDAIVATYHRHPALMAYFVTDEPSAAEFAGLGEVAAYLKTMDPDHPAYVNLFPIHADPVGQLGAGTYEEYVGRFVKQVDPFVISYDHYPFRDGGDNPQYFTNLAIIRNASISSKRPFWNIAQLVKHYDYRALTEPELRFQAMQTLAFGGKGLLWYTYWYPGEPNPTVDHAMIAHDGTPTREYAWIKSINADARAIGNELMACESSWATFHTGEPVEYAAPPKTPLAVEGAGRFTTGVFNGPGGKTLALVTNRDYAKPARALVRVVPAAGTAMEKFDSAATKWGPAALDGNGGLVIDLPAGAGVLLRWVGSN
jgi:hypothetical protein